jgi:hypothetical protein
MCKTNCLSMLLDWEWGNWAREEGKEKEKESKPFI